ncbi:MAG: NACHT domain-containing protein, partial [Geitlerinemataceae cyanobacterium]
MTPEQLALLHQMATPASIASLTAIATQARAVWNRLHGWHRAWAFILFLSASSLTAVVSKVKVEDTRLWLPLLGLTVANCAVLLWLIWPVFMEAAKPDLKALREKLRKEVAKTIAQRLKSSLDRDIYAPVVADRKEKQVTLSAAPEPGLRPMVLLEQAQNTVRKVWEKPTTIRAVYEKEADERLLILGEPGSGKTTELLKLAQVLCEEARDETKPIPIIFELSAWRSREGEPPPIDEWAIEQMNDKYGLDPDIIRGWLETEAIVPLFDGLDELKERKSEAIAAINKLQANKDKQLRRLVVCSRIEDYEAAVAETGEKLRLETAVCLRALENAQIQKYLGERGAGYLWEWLRRDSQMLNLARRPLLLDLLPVAFPDPDDLPVLAGAASEEERRALLFEAYLDRRLAEDDGGYDPADTRRYLQWLAVMLKRLGQTEFLVEKMQPTWLETRELQQRYQRRYRLIFGLIVGLIGGLIGGLIVGLIGGLIVGLIGGLIGGLRVGLIGQVTTEGATVGRTVGTLDGALDGVPGSMPAGMSDRLVVGLISGLIVGLIAGLPAGLVVEP